MSSVFDVARSGLSAAERRLSTSAHNVANALTTGFRPLAVVAQEQPGGGVTARVVRPNDPAVESRLDALALGSGTDLATEMVSQMTAAAAYRANLATLRTADEMEGALVAVRA